jgi:ankyrin repeat protein
MARRSDTRKKTRRDYRKTRRAAKKGGDFLNFFRKKPVHHVSPVKGYNPYNNIKGQNVFGLVNVTDAKNSDGQKLIASVRAGKDKEVHALLKTFKVNPNVIVISKGHNNKLRPAVAMDTPLTIAIKQDEIDMVKLLLEHGANPKLPSKPGYRPIDIINKDTTYDLVFHDDMLEALKAHGANN